MCKLELPKCNCDWSSKYGSHTIGEAGCQYYIAYQCQSEEIPKTIPEFKDSDDILYKGNINVTIHPKNEFVDFNSWRHNVIIQDHHYHRMADIYSPNDKIKIYCHFIRYGNNNVFVKARRRKKPEYHIVCKYIENGDYFILFDQVSTMQGSNKVAINRKCYNVVFNHLDYRLEHDGIFHKDKLRYGGYKGLLNLYLISNEDNILRLALLDNSKFNRKKPKFVLIEDIIEDQEEVNDCDNTSDDRFYYVDYDNIKVKYKYKIQMDEFLEATAMTYEEFITMYFSKELANRHILQQQIVSNYSTHE